MPKTTRAKPDPRPARRTPARPAAAGAALSPEAALAANHLGVLWTTLDAALSPSFGELSGASAALLQWLHHWAPMGVVELARVAGLSQPACTRAVERLVQQGLLRRLPGSGKEVPLALTPQGSAAARRMQAQRLQACDNLLAPLSAAERETWQQLVIKLVQAPVTDRAYARHVCRYCDHVRCDGPACPVGCRATALEDTAASVGQRRGHGLGDRQ